MNKHSFYSLKALAFVAIALLFSAFVSGDSESNEQRFKNAALNLDKTYHTLTDEFDYWPECGIRVTGSHLASLISLTDLQNMLPYPLYLSGPHHDGQWDLNNEDDYGHYNPKAIEYLAGLAKTVVSDEIFVEKSKPLVDKYLYRQMHIMMVIHDALYDGFTQEDRETILSSSLETKGNDYASVGGFELGRLNLEDGTYVYGNIDYRFLHFWARRWGDGTIDQFYQGLSTIFKAYYPDYEYSPDIYWTSEEEYEGEWYGDEEFEENTDFYVVIDGSDLRLRLGPSTDAETVKWPDGTNRHPKIGERFLYLDEEGDFYLISFYGTSVWVSKKYTHLEAE